MATAVYTVSRQTAGAGARAGSQPRQNVVIDHPIRASHCQNRSQATIDRSLLARTLLIDEQKVAKDPADPQIQRLDKSQPPKPCRSVESALATQLPARPSLPCRRQTCTISLSRRLRK